MLDQFRTQKLEWNRANNQIYDRVEANSGDSNGRTLFVQISNDGLVEDLTGAVLSLAWNKRTEQGLEAFDEIDAKKGQFRLFYPTGMLVNTGVLKASLVLVDVTGRIESKSFDIIVHKGMVDDEAVESDNKFTALTTALVKVSQVQAEFDGLYADKSQMMDTLHDDKKADMETLEADYSNRANTLETTYAPRLTGVEGEIDEVSAQLAQTATQKYVDELAQGLANGSPKGVFPTIADLENTHPNGTTGIFVVSANGHWYFWDNSSWKSGGVYMGDGIDKLEVYDALGLVATNFLELTNLFENGDFSNGTTNVAPTGGTLQVTNNILEYTTTSLNATARINFTIGQSINGHKYYAFGWIKPKYNNPTRFYTGANHPDILNLVPNEWNFISSVASSRGGSSNPYLLHATDTQYSIGDVIYYKYIGCIDLTMMYGEGSEPTKGEMDSIISGQYPETRWFKGTKEFRGEVTYNNGKVLGVMNDEVSLVSLDDLGLSGGENVFYVTLNGSDSNDGRTESTGFATLQKALDNGATAIYVERGIYYNQSATKQVEKVSIFPMNNGLQKIEFRGSDTLDSNDWTSHNSIFKQPYEGNQYFTSVFINQSQPIVKDESRGIYNANVWEGNDKVNDIRLKPVLTLSECEGEQGTFYYDGTDLYVNPSDGIIEDKEYNVNKLDVGLNLTGGKVEIHDVKFDFYHDDPVNLDNVKSVYVQNSEAGHSSSSDGFSIDNTNGRFVNCKAYKNAIDGFNLHDKGDTEFINCDGINNYDDGISHHNDCTGVIIGGNWRGNGKGGISPASGAKVNWYNAVMEDNLYGAYHSNIAGVESISSGNLYLNNHRGIANNNAKVTSFNDKFVGNEIDTIGSGETVIY